MLISKFGSAQRNEIRSFNPSLPDELVRFLEKYNGGETPETHFDINRVSTDIVAFYGIGNVKCSLKNVDVIEERNNQYLPVAFDSFGNQIVISMATGSVHFWDHEQGKVTKELAHSLSDFISKVQSDPVASKHTRPIHEREQDLIRRGRGAIITDALRDMWQSEIDKYSNYHQETVVL